MIEKDEDAARRSLARVVARTTFLSLIVTALFFATSTQPLARALTPSSRTPTRAPSPHPSVASVAETRFGGWRAPPPPPASTPRPRASDRTIPRARTNSIDVIKRRPARSSVIERPLASASPRTSRNRSIDSCIHPARVVRSSHRARTIPLDSLDEIYPRPNSSSRARVPARARVCRRRERMGDDSGARARGWEG